MKINFLDIRRFFSLALVFCLLVFLPACATVSGWFGESEPAPEENVALKHWNQGLQYRAEGELESAAAELERAIKADRSMYQAYYQLGLVYKDLKQPELARQAWEYGLEEARKSPDRPEYPKEQAIAEMQAALTGLESRPKETPLEPEPKKSKPEHQMKKTVESGAYAVLFSSNLKESNARKDFIRLKSMGYETMIKQHKDSKGRIWHRVWVGCCQTRDKALRLARSMRKKGLKSDLTVMRP
jgi:cell division septation protein DedD